MWIEIMNIGVIDIDNHECMTLDSIQTPDCKTLESMNKSLMINTTVILSTDKINGKGFPIGWLLIHSFSKEASITPMYGKCFPCY